MIISTKRVGPPGSALFVYPFCAGGLAVIDQEPLTMPINRSRTSRFVKETGVAADIAALAEPVLEDMGLRLVRVVVSGRDGGTVQIMAERPGGAITVDDCANVSRALSPLLDVHDPMPGRYHLEVSSPGIDRPLVRPSDFDDWKGFEAKIELREPVAGRKRFRGFIEGFEDGEVHLRVNLPEEHQTQILGFDISQIEQAKLIMTDELISAALARQKH